MSSLRFMCRGRVNKPLPSALVTALPTIKANLTDLQTYAQRLNAGQSNQEETNKVEWGDAPTYIWLVLDVAVPLPLPAALSTKLPAIRSKIQQLKQYAVNTGEAAFYGQYHICHHGDMPSTCEAPQEI